MLRPGSLLQAVFFWLGMVMTLFALYAAFMMVPNDKGLGFVQRIFYFHVPQAWVAFLAFFITFLGGIMYLRTRNPRWDAIALSSAEIGVVFTTAALISGSIFARPTWGTWWTWEPRLTTTLILWLIYVAYLMLRKLVDEESQRARIAAVVGIVGFVDVPIVFMSIWWWRTMHPIVFTTEEVKMPPIMLYALIAALAAFTLFYVHVLSQRVALEEMRRDLEQLKQRVGLEA